MISSLLTGMPLFITPRTSSPNIAMQLKISATTRLKDDTEDKQIEADGGYTN